MLLGIFLCGCLQEERESAHLAELLKSEALDAMASPLTDDESLDLYCSFFKEVLQEHERGFYPRRASCFVHIDNKLCEPEELESYLYFCACRSETHGFDRCQGIIRSIDVAFGVRLVVAVETDNGHEKECGIHPETSSYRRVLQNSHDNFSGCGDRFFAPQ